VAGARLELLTALPQRDRLLRTFRQKALVLQALRLANLMRSDRCCWSPSRGWSQRATDWSDRFPWPR